MSNQLRKQHLLRSAFILALLWPSTGFAQTAITWASQTNVTVAGTVVTKTGGGSGNPNAGALSTEQLASGAGGTFTFTTRAVMAEMVIGLSNDTAADSFATMTHSFYIGVDGTAAIYEGGPSGYKTETSYTVGDTLSFEVSSSGGVVYKKNSTTIYTSLSNVTLPVKLDLEILTMSAGLQDATITAAGGGGGPSGTTWTVCASGCDFTNSQLQTALNTAVAGTTILLQEGFTYVGDYSFPVYSGAGAGSEITVRTGVSSTGVVQATSRYTADNIRICPSTFNVDWMNCSTMPGSQDMTRIAKLQPASNNSYGLKTANTGSGTPVSYWKFQWLEFIAQSYGGNSIIGITNETVPTNGAVSMLPHHITFDRIVVRGDPVSGQFRGIELNGSYITIVNSFVYDIKAMTEGQGMWANTSVGGLTLINNYVSGGTEVWLTGGGGTQIRRSYTVGAGATTTTLPLDSVTDLYVGKDIAVRLNPRTIVSNTSASPSVFTTSGAHGLSVGEQIYLSGVTCSGANIYAGQTNASGSGPWPVWTVDTVPSSTTFTLMITEGVRTPLNCGTGGSGGTLTTRASAQITNISSNTITVSPALPSTPANGDTIATSIVIGQGASNTFRYNVFTRPSSYRTTGIQAPVTSPSATGSTTGGSLAAGTYYYTVVAQRRTAQDVYASSTASTQVSGTVSSGSSGSVTISWTAAANASRYVVYGRGNGSITQSWTVTAPTTTFTDTGAAGSGASGTPSQSFWQVKNTFEWKQAMNVTAEYNLIENSWTAGQSGPCFVLTSTQQMAQAPSATIRNFTFQKNVVRECAQFLQIPGTDAQAAESARSGAITLTNNLWYNANGTTYGAQNGIILGGNGGGPRQHPNRAPYDLTITNNTFHSPGGSYSRLLYMDYCDFAMADSRESPSPNFIWRDNIGYAGASNYVMASTGTTTSFCNAGTTPRRWGMTPNGPLGTGSIVSYNVFAGDTCASYPTNVTNSFCPSIATLESGSFTNTTSIAGFALKAGSPYLTAGSTGGKIGADIATFEPSITTITMTGNNTGGGVALSITTTSPLPSGTVGVAYSTSMAATGGTAPYTWALTSGTMPTGLSLNTSTGVISGTPTGTASASLTIRVTDSASATDSKVFALTINAGTALSITTTSLPNGYTNTAYSTTLNAAGGTTPYTWTKTSGTLPAGLSFSSAGVLSGTPTTAVNNRSLTFQVTDGASATASKTLTLTISPCTSRGTRYNWSWGAFFVQETKPAVTSASCGDQPRTGDIWYKPSTSTHYKLSVSGSTVTETALATGGGSSVTGAWPVQFITFWAGTTQANTPLASPTTAANEMAGQRMARPKVDVENSTQCAVTATVVDGSTVVGNTLKLQYWNGSTWVDAGCSAPVDVTGPVVSEGTFATLATLARTQDRIFRLLYSTGDGVDTVSVAGVQVRFR